MNDFPWRTLVTTLFGSSVVAWTALAEPPPKLLWNATASVPIGLYAVRPAGQLAVTDLVVVQPPEPLAAFLADGGYLAYGVPLLKRVAALPGERVCREGPRLTVRGVTWAMARERDSNGRVLPTWGGCRVVAEGELFLLNWEEPDSLDGRYFGPLPASAVIGRARPIWTKEGE